MGATVSRSSPAITVVSVSNPSSPTPIFVFGSNARGIHGSGAAKAARFQWGAVLGVGEGLTGRSYALPTKETPYSARSLQQVAVSVQRFLELAARTPSQPYWLTRIGCGRAGFKEADIAELFRSAPSNVLLVDDDCSPVCLASQWIERLSPRASAPTTPSLFN